MLRGILTVGGWTLISRILGFARDMLIAALIGTGPIADAFVSRDHDPLVPPRGHEPLGVFGILSKVIVVNLNLKASSSKNSGHLVPPKLAVEEESQFFKRLLRG